MSELHQGPSKVVHILHRARGALASGTALVTKTRCAGLGRVRGFFRADQAPAAGFPVVEFSEDGENWSISEEVTQDTDQAANTYPVDTAVKGPWVRVRWTQGGTSATAFGCSIWLDPCCGSVGGPGGSSGPNNNATRGAVTPANGTTLTTAYGTASAGWVTPAINVEKYDVLELAFTYADHDSGSSISILPRVGDSGDSDEDDGIPLQRVASDGALSDDELTKAVSADTTFSVTMDVRGISRLYVAAKIDDATNDPTLSLEYNGHHETSESATPAVS